MLCDANGFMAARRMILKKILSCNKRPERKKEKQWEKNYFFAVSTRD